MRKRIFVLFLSLLIVICSVYVPEGGTYAAHKVKLNKTRLNLTVGKSYKLKVRHFTGKVKWKSSKKKIVKVTKKGKVTAKKTGKAKVWAILPDRKLKCKVRVRNKNAVSDMDDIKGSSVMPQNNGGDVYVPSADNDKGAV